MRKQYSATFKAAPWGHPKKNLVSTLSRSERLALVERDAYELPLSVQVELLSLSRAQEAPGLYYQPLSASAEEHLKT